MHQSNPTRSRDVRLAGISGVTKDKRGERAEISNLGSYYYLPRKSSRLPTECGITRWQSGAECQAVLEVFLQFFYNKSEV